MSKRILIVDDFNELKEILRLWLEEFGFQIVEAHNGAEALECFEWAAPDLILMDLAMPGTDGITAINQIRKMEAGRNIPIIGMTGYVEWFREKALQVGCDKVIGKHRARGRAEFRARPRGSDTPCEASA